MLSLKLTIILFLITLFFILFTHPERKNINIQSTTLVSDIAFLGRIYENFKIFFTKIFKYIIKLLSNNLSELSSVGVFVWLCEIREIGAFGDAILRHFIVHIYEYVQASQNGYVHRSYYHQFIERVTKIYEIEQRGKPSQNCFCGFSLFCFFCFFLFF